MSTSGIPTPPATVQPNLPGAFVLRPSALAFVVATLTFAAFITVGGMAQVLNAGVGLWFTEVFLFLAVAWVGVAASGREPARYFGLSSPRPAGLAFSFVLGALNFFAIVVPLQFLAQKLAPDWVRELFDASHLFDDKSPADLAWVLTAVTIAAPVCEEIFFRGALQNSIARALQNPVRATVLTALLFAAFHVDPVGFLARFELGLVFGLLYWRSGSVWPGVMAHAANNLISSTLFLAARTYGGGVLDEDPSPLAVLGMFLLGTALLAGLLRLPAQSPGLLAAPHPPAEIHRPFRRRQLLGWALAATVWAGLFAALDLRGIRLSLVELRYPLTRPTRRAGTEERVLWERLVQLRAKARAGAAEIEEYAREREKAQQQRERQRPPATNGTAAAP